RIRTGADEPDARVLDRAGDAAAEVAFRRHQHADVPVLGDDRGPVAGEVDGRGRLCRRRRTRLAPASLRLRQSWKVRLTADPTGKTQQNDRDHTKAIPQFNPSIRQFNSSIQFVNSSIRQFVNSEFVYSTVSPVLLPHDLPSV